MRRGAAACAALRQLDFLTWTHDWYNKSKENYVPEDLSPYVETIRRRMKLEEAAKKKQIERAHLEVERLVSDFQELDPAIRKIVLFGSLASGNVRSRDFDIDIAVDCSPDRYLHLVSRGLNSPFRVDVVELASVADYIRDAIDKSGVVLYER